MTKKKIWSGKSKFLKAIAQRKDGAFELVADLGSGMNYRKRGASGGYDRQRRGSCLHAFLAISPPSTGITAPVRNEAAGRHRLSVMWATSSASP